MKSLLRIFTLLLIFSAMTAFAQSASAARLASASGTAGQEQIEEYADFKLSDQDAVRVNYDIIKTADKSSVQIKLYREQNGRWRVVNIVHRTTSSSKGFKPLTLSAGSYRIKVIGTNAKFDVSVDN